MSNINQVAANEEDHTGPVKNPKQLLMAVFFSFVIPVFAIIGLVLAPYAAGYLSHMKG